MSAPPVQGIAILLWSADLSQPQRVATPFVMAQAALALDQAVEIYFTAQCVQLLTPQAGTQAVGFGAQAQPVSVYLRQVREMGGRFFACGQALRGAGLALADLVPECEGQGGAVQFMERSADPHWRTLVF